MPHPSKRARKARNQNRVTISTQLRTARGQNVKLAQLAANGFNQTAHLAKMMAYVVAKFGVKGSLAIPDRELAMMPDGAKLREHYDPETDSTVLTSIVVRDEAPTDALQGIEPSPIIALESSGLVAL